MIDRPETGILRDNRALAAIEFALMSALFMVLFLVVCDFGRYLIYKRQLGEALASAGAEAFANRTTISATTIQAYVQAIPTMATTSVTVTCNGSSTCINTGRTCACLGTTGLFTIAASCGATCSGTSLMSGYFLQLSATRPYSSLVIPGKFLDGSTVRATYTVQLQ